MKLPGGLATIGTACLIAALLIANPSPDDEGEVPTGRGSDESGAAVAPDAVKLPGEETIRVVPIGVDKSGTLEPPESVKTVGWWRGGAALGDSSGTVVLAGHVDGAGQGLGSFAPLWDVRKGQTVRLRGPGDRDIRYRITGRRVHSRTKALPPGIFAQEGKHRLALITCAGRFDPKTRHYSDTLVVYAVPVT